MRLIDADVLREVMYHEAFEKDTDMQKWDGGCWIRYKMFENAIENAPTIEAEPVKRGEWIDDGFYADYYGHHEYRCSECGECYIDYEIEWHYCPNCGAKMKPISASPENG